MKEMPVVEKNYLIVPVSEKHNLEAYVDYTATKVEARKRCIHYWREFKMLCIFRKVEK